MTKFLSWLANLFVLSPFLREKQKAMRQSWPLAAAHLDLVFSPGRNLYDDKITGILDGYPVAIYNEFDLDVQKLVTLIRVFSEGVLSTSKNLSRKELLAQYDKSVETCGALSDGMLSEDQRAWFLGHRRGI